MENLLIEKMTQKSARDFVENCGQIERKQKCWQSEEDEVLQKQSWNMLK